ncbi:hypothetical protein [uncultured Legionella sp.]|uniref:hypothetical protein n=1 Tax=uncultured Legionella sp. TaxID=210934 RepID=UPI002602C9BA|nr:hypothetical protein [uncultured Legionella sp.]
MFEEFYNQLKSLKNDADKIKAISLLLIGYDELEIINFNHILKILVLFEQSNRVAAFNALKNNLAETSAQDFLSDIANSNITDAKLKYTILEHLALSFSWAINEAQARMLHTSFLGTQFQQQIPVLTERMTMINPPPISGVPVIPRPRRHHLGFYNRAQEIKTNTFNIPINFDIHNERYCVVLVPFYDYLKQGDQTKTIYDLQPFLQGPYGMQADSFIPDLNDKSSLVNVLMFTDKEDMKQFKS